MSAFPYGPKNSLLAHPVTIFCGVWSVVFVLYAAKLSFQLVFDVHDYLYLYATITLVFAITCYVSELPIQGHRRHRARTITASVVDEASIERVRKRLCVWFGLWCLATVGEVIVSDGVPALWYYQGSGKQHFDFGITSIHGLLMSLVLACATLSYYLFQSTGRRWFLGIPIFTICWCIVLVSRNFFIGLLLQLLFVKITLRRISRAEILAAAILALLLVVFFGVLGDFRTGSEELILSLGQPTDRFPDWLPSGFLWVYIYVTTPLNNLINNLDIGRPGGGYSVLATTANLLPTFIRTAIYPVEFLEQGDLIDPNLNVSTAFIAPFKDAGMLGVALYSAFSGAVAGWFWSRRRHTFFLLGYAFVAQTLVLSIFYNQLLYLPYLMQLVWFAAMLRGTTGVLRWSRGRAARWPNTAPARRLQPL